MGADLRSWDELDVLTRLLPNLDVTGIRESGRARNSPIPRTSFLERTGTSAWVRTWCYAFVLLWHVSPSAGQGWTSADPDVCNHANIPPRKMDGVRSESHGRQVRYPRRRAVVVLPKSSQGRLSHQRRTLCGISICRNTEVGLETGSRLGFTNSSANVLQLISKSQASDGSP